MSPEYSSFLCVLSVLCAVLWGFCGGWSVLSLALLLCQVVGLHDVCHFCEFFVYSVYVDL